MLYAFLAFASFSMQWRRCATGLLGVCWCLSGWSTSVAFINPGKVDEVFWATSAAMMGHAAQDLGMQFEVLYASRDHVRGVELARQLAQRPVSERPRYVVITNDYGTAPEMLRQLGGSGIQVFIAYSGLQGRARQELGGPREKQAHWLGSMEPKSEDAGYLSARALIAKARSAGAALGPDGKLHFLALAGDRSTPASIARNAGMRRAVKEAPDVVLDQEVYADWRRDKAVEQASWLYQRHAGARLVWAGSDQMAFGAMDAWRQRGGTPGLDAWFSGINTSPEAFAALHSGELTALVGGHFLLGAWTMVQLFDHSRGVDFVSEGLEQQRAMFVLFDTDLARKFEQRMSQPGLAIDFKRFSKVLNPKLRRYAFEAEHWLK